MIRALIGLQLFQVLFLALHDWAPLPPLNDVKSVQAADTRRKLIVVTALSTLPYAFGLAASLYFADTHFPGWLILYLRISYAALFIGQLRAWWVPYLLRPEPVRAARYRAMFGRTHAFLPERNGIRPNSLHILLHISTLATLILLA